MGDVLARVPGPAPPGGGAESLHRAFFLDEATALAAGHRPCGECRRPDLRRFRTAWLRGNPERGVASDALTEAIDRELHRDRLAADRRPVTYPADLTALPDGALSVVADGNEALLLWRGALLPWSPAGYGAPRPRPGRQRVTVLTPRSTVAAIAAGYTPAVHWTAASAGAAGSAGTSPLLGSRPAHRPVGRWRVMVARADTSTPQRSGEIVLTVGTSR